jgi:pSer/pThr/pTyr-binding forkhead associated (FHA) protein
MDDFRQTLGRADLPRQQPNGTAGKERELPAGFLPLRLLVQPGGLCVELNRPDMLVGRHTEADVRLALPDVSRRHCRFLFANGRWQVYDLNSLNGVYVNEERLQEATLCQGDLVRIGSLSFLVDLGPGAKPAGILGRINDVFPSQDHRKAS